MKETQDTSNEKARIIHPCFEARTDLETLFREQNVSPVTNFEELLGDFWPEEESTDEFIATLRSWRNEGKGGQG